jgi:hypothetical protein
MNNDDSFPDDGREYSGEPKYDLILVQKILYTIGNYTRGATSPASLRDSMLAVAAVLHIEAAEFGASSSPKNGHKSRLDEAFADCAREQLRAVRDATALVARPQ